MEKVVGGLSEWRVNVERGARTCHVDVVNVDPYEFPVFSFYQEDLLLGYLPCMHIKQMEGLVLLDLLLPSISLDQANLYLLPPLLAEVKDEDLFAAAPFQNLTKEPSSIVSTFELEHRAICIVREERKMLGYSFVLVTACAQLAMIMRRARIPLEWSDRTASRFEDSRLKLEKDLFMERIAPFVKAGAERNLLRLLLHQGYEKDTLFQQCVVNGTAQDSIMTLSLGLYRPRIYLAVPFTELPSHLASSYLVQLKHGGLVSLHPAHAGEWLWQRQLLFWRSLNAYIWRAPYEELREWPLFHVARSIFQIYQWSISLGKQPVYHPLYLPSVEEEHAKKRKQQNSLESFEPKYSGVGVDMLPACMRLGQWPKVEERRQIAYNMRKAEIDIEDCANIFYEMRKLALPATTRAASDRAADVKSLYAKEYNMYSCKTLIANRGSPLRIIRCPYAEATAEGCKAACVAELKSHYERPPRSPTPEFLYAPFKYMKWRQEANNYAKRTSSAYQKSEQQKQEEQERQLQEEEAAKKRRKKEKMEQQLVEYWGLDL